MANATGPDIFAFFLGHTHIFGGNYGNGTRPLDQQIFSHFDRKFYYFQSGGRRLNYFALAFRPGLLFHLLTKNDF